MINRKLACTFDIISSFTPASFFIFHLLFIILSSSCKNPEKQGVNEKPYFDLTSFFNGQITKLNHDSLIVIKTSAINGKTDEHRMNWTDWKREFVLFLESDINKSSLIGKYLIDTLGENNSAGMKIRYQAIDSLLRTRLLEVSFRDQAVKEIYIINKTSGFLSSSSENLLYHPLELYIIKTATQNRLFGMNDFSVMGKITTKEKKYF